MKIRWSILRSKIMQKPQQMLYGSEKNSCCQMQYFYVKIFFTNVQVQKMGSVLHKAG